MKQLLLFVAVVFLARAASNYQLVCDDVLTAVPGSNFRYELRTIGGSGRYGYEVDGLPEGLKNQGPIIAGIPKTSGRFPLSIRSYDDQGNYAVKSVVINVDAGSNGAVFVNGQQVGNTGSVTSLNGQSSTTTITVNSGGVSTSTGAIGGGISGLIGNTGSTLTTGGLYGPTGAIGTTGLTTGGSTDTVTINVSGGSSTTGITGATGTFPAGLSPTGTFPTGLIGSPSFPGSSFPGSPSFPSGGSPTGGSPSGSSPSGGSPTGSAPSSGPGLIGSFPSGPGSPTGPSPSGTTSTSTTTTIITSSNRQLAPPSVGYNPNYPTGPGTSYPTQQFPTGTSPNFVSSNIPTQISNYQYTVNTSRDTYQATTSDIQSQAIFQRQIDANKAVANLLSIIQQLTANVNGVQADIPAATAAVNQAIADQRTVQQRVIAAENANKTLTANIATVRNDISTFQQTLTQVSNNLNNGQAAIDGNNSLKISITTNLTDAQTRATALQTALNAANDAIKGAQNNINALNQNISGYQSQIATIQQDIDNAPTYMASYDAKVKDLSNTIAALEAQLADLKNQRDAAQNKSNYYRTLNATAGAQIRQLQNLINGLTIQITGTYQPIITNANAQVAKITSDLNNLLPIISDLTARSQQVDIAIETAKRNRDGVSVQYTSIVTNINRSTTTLNNLLSQVPAYNNALVQAYNDGNDANDRYAQLKAVLDALNAKYLSSLNELNDAKAALEKARAEKEISDIAVNEQIRKQGGSSILPYSIPGTTTGSTSTTIISAGGPTGGRWIVSGSGLPEGTPIGTTSTGLPIIAGSTATGATGIVTGRTANGGYIISGLGSTQGTVIGTTAGGNTIIAGQGTVITTRKTSGSSSTVLPSAPSGDLTHYISSSLSRGVSSSVLYPFIMRWGLQGQLGSFSCSASGATEDSAIISSINPSSFTVTGSSGDQLQLNVGSCTTMQANRQDYQPSVGDRISWSGWKDSAAKSVNAASIACYA